jgi:hypothetical protein
MRIRKTKSVNEKPWLLLVCGAFAFDVCLQKKKQRELVRMGGDFVCGHRVSWYRLIVIFVQKCVYLDVFWCVDSRIS